MGCLFILRRTIVAKTSLKRLLSFSSVSVLALMATASISHYAKADALIPESCSAEMGSGSDSDGCAALLQQLSLAPAAGAPGSLPGQPTHGEFDAKSNAPAGGHDFAGRNGNSDTGNDGDKGGKGSSGNGGGSSGSGNNGGSTGGDNNGGGDGNGGGDNGGNGDGNG